MKLKLDIRLKIAEFWQCRISALKSPSITQGAAHSVTCVNSLVSNESNVAWGTLGDLYTSAICQFSPFGSSKVADTASMPVVANLCTLVGFSWLGTQISTPPLLSHVTLSHLISI